MVLTLAGGLLAALGLASGVLLLASAAGWLLWLLFVLFSAAGFLLLASGGQGDQARTPLRWLSFAWLGLALLAALALFAHAAGLRPAPHGTAALWVVLLVAGAAGGLGSAALTKRADDQAGDEVRERPGALPKR